MKVKDYLLRIISLIEEQDNKAVEQGDCNSNIDIFTCLDGVERLHGVESCRHWYDGKPYREVISFEITFYVERKGNQGESK